MIDGKVWDVWCEGYSATCDRGYAKLIGRTWAVTFNRACELLYNEKGGDDQLGYFTPATPDEPPSYWGCRLYDNEADARRTFG